MTRRHTLFGSVVAPLHRATGRHHRRYHQSDRRVYRLVANRLIDSHSTHPIPRRVHQRNLKFTHTLRRIEVRHKEHLTDPHVKRLLWSNRICQRQIIMAQHSHGRILDEQRKPDDFYSVHSPINADDKHHESWGSEGGDECANRGAHVADPDDLRQESMTQFSTAAVHNTALPESIRHSERVERQRMQRIKDYESAKRKTLTWFTLFVSIVIFLASQLHICLTDRDIWHSKDSELAYVWITVRLGGNVLFGICNGIWIILNLRHPPPSLSDIEDLDERHALRVLRRRAVLFSSSHTIWAIIKAIWMFFGIYAILVKWNVVYNIGNHHALMIWAVIFWSFTALQVTIALFATVLLSMMLCIGIARTGDRHGQDVSAGLSDDDWQKLLSSCQYSFHQLTDINQDQKGPDNKIAGDDMAIEALEAQTPTNYSISNQSMPGAIIRALSNLGEIPSIFNRALSIAESPIGECPICMGEFEDDGEMIIVLPCHESHSVHTNCLQPWITEHSSCPTCRASIHDGLTLNVVA